MLLAQGGIAIGLVRIAFSHPGSGVLRMALWALFTTFFAATQDIAMDAWRIESAPDRDAGCDGRSLPGRL